MGPRGRSYREIEEHTRTPITNHPRLLREVAKKAGASQCTILQWVLGTLAKREAA